MTCRCSCKPKLLNCPAFFWLRVKLNYPSRLSKSGRVPSMPSQRDRTAKRGQQYDHLGEINEADGSRSNFVGINIAFKFKCKNSLKKKIDIYIIIQFWFRGYLLDPCSVLFLQHGHHCLRYKFASRDDHFCSGFSFPLRHLPSSKCYIQD